MDRVPREARTATGGNRGGELTPPREAERERHEVFRVPADGEAADEEQVVEIREGEERAEAAAREARERQLQLRQRRARSEEHTSELQSH